MTPMSKAARRAMAQAESATKRALAATEASVERAIRAASVDPEPPETTEKATTTPDKVESG